MADQDVDNVKSPLIEHLTELRKRLIHCVLVFLGCMVLCFAFWEPVFDVLTAPVCDALHQRGQQCNLILIKLQEGFFVAVRISLMGGFILSFPFLSYQLWRFVAPGLYKKEKNAFLPFIIASPFMFLLGAAFAFFIVIPLAFNFFLSFQKETPVAGLNQENAVVQEYDSTENVPPIEFIEESTSTDISVPINREVISDAGVTFQGSVAEYLTLTIKFVLAFGVCFQLPVLLTLMGKAGLVSAKSLATFRKYAVVGILVLAAIVTPPDVITQIILFSAVYGLYEVSIILVRRVEKSREKMYREQGIYFDDDEEPTKP